MTIINFLVPILLALVLILSVRVYTLEKVVLDLQDRVDLIEDNLIDDMKATYVKNKKKAYDI